MISEKEGKPQRCFLCLLIGWFERKETANVWEHITIIETDEKINVGVGLCKEHKQFILENDLLPALELGFRRYINHKKSQKKGDLH